MKRWLVAGAATTVGWCVLLAIVAWRHGPAMSEKPAVDPVVVDEWMPVIAGELADGATGFQLNDAGEVLLVARPVPFDAAALPLLELSVQNLPLNYVVMFAWTIKGAPEPHFRRLQPALGTPQRYLLSRFEQWQGEVVEIALYMHPQQQSSPPQVLAEPLRIETTVFAPDSLTGRVSAVLTEWAAPDPWEMMSISSLGALRDLDEESRLLPFAAGCTLIAILCFGVAASARTPRQWIRVAAPSLLVATVIMTLLFVRSLHIQRQATDSLYATLSPDQQQARQFDAAVYEIVRELEPTLPKPGTARIFIGADDRFFQLRTAWYLRPHNVITRMPGQNASVPESVEAGDYILFVRRPDLQVAGKQGIVSTGDDAIRVAMLKTVSDDAGVMIVKGIGK